MQLLNLKCRTEGEKMSEDLRVTKTKQNIQSTFIRLLEDYSFQNITIKPERKEEAVWTGESR